MKLVDLLAGSKTHTLDFFPPTVVANVEKHLADKDGKPVIRCLVRDKLFAAKPEEIVRQLWLEQLVRAYKYDVRRLAVEVPITFGRDTSERAVEIAIEQDEQAALKSLEK
ncbi:MAG: type I restriction enzyme HsdR N-terminal domain-containing protein [Limisphaerales bacterium]